MTGLAAAAEALAAVLAAENAALAAFDLGHAAAMLAAKTAAAAQFEQAANAADAPQLAAARATALRIQTLAQDNRALLERALHVQGRVLSTIAAALPRALAAAPRYGASGSLTQAARSHAIALSARI